MNKRDTYHNYANELYKKGICPDIIVVKDIIKLLTEDEDSLKYNFSTKNIISGPYGELIKINKEKGTIEIYNSYTIERDDYLKEYNYSLRIFDLETGLMFPDGELGNLSTSTDSIDLYGEETFDYIDELSINDFSDFHRRSFMEDELLDIKRLEFANQSSRGKVLDLKEKIFKVAKKYCKRNDFINDGIAKIICNIDNAYTKHLEKKLFSSSILDNKIVETINNKLYLDFLKEENEAYSKISITPIIDIIEEYKAYHTPKTDLIAKKYINISKKISEVLDPFIFYRINIRNHQMSSKDINELYQKRHKALIKRRDELDGTNTWGLDE